VTDLGEAGRHCSPRQPWPGGSMGSVRSECESSSSFLVPLEASSV
jgi:hypothetical protein